MAHPRINKISGKRASTDLEKLVKELLLVQGSSQRDFGNINGANRIEWGLTAFNELKVAEKTQQFVLNANYPLSSQRDDWDAINGASISQVNGAEYLLKTNNTANGNAYLRSKQRGLYIPGNLGEAGLGARLDRIPTDTGAGAFGYLTPVGGNLTGYGYLFMDGKIYVAVWDSDTLRNPTYKEPQDNWNLNSLSEADEFQSDPFSILQGATFEINYIYYGYGPVVWAVGDTYDAGKTYADIPIHIFKRQNELSIQEPNLNMYAVVDGGANGEDFEIYIGGRQYSTFGKQVPVERPIGEIRIGQTVGTSFVPLIGIRELEGFKNVQTTFKDLVIRTDGDIEYRLVKNPASVNGAWADPGDYDVGEFANEFNITATTISGYTQIGPPGIAEGGASNKEAANSFVLPERPLYEDDSYFLIGRTFASTATVDTVITLGEKW